MKGLNKAHRGVCLVCTLVVMAIALATLVALMFQSDKLFPLSGSFQLHFQVDSAFISSLNTTTSPAELTATWDITLFAAKSDDKFIIDYDAVQVWLYYGKSTEDNTFVLATTILPPFELSPTRNQTRLSFKLATLGAYVGDDVVKNMTEAAAAGRVTTAFGLKVVAEYWLRKIGVKGTRQVSTRFFCNEVSIGIPTNNQSWSDSGASKACKKGYWNGHWDSQPLNRLW